MRRCARCASIVLLLLLASVGTASAAWVLWIETTEWIEPTDMREVLRGEGLRGKKSWEREKSGYSDWSVENTWRTLHAHFGLICGISRMNAPQASEIPSSSAAWYHFTRPSIARRFTSGTFITSSTAEVWISSNPPPILIEVGQAFRRWCK